MKEALATLSEKDVIIIECLDNTAYYARTEEGGDIPVRRWINKEFHVEGELTLATQERQAIMLENLEPLFALPQQDCRLCYANAKISVCQLL